MRNAIQRVECVINYHFFMFVSSLDRYYVHCMCNTYRILYIFIIYKLLHYLCIANKVFIHLMECLCVFRWYFYLF